MGPRQGAGKFDIDSDALIVGYLRTDGRHVVVLAISGLGTTTFIRSDAGKVQLKSRNDSGKAQSQHALVATGLDWQVTVSAAFAAARDLLAHSGITEETAPPDLEAYWRESWYDGLGYCTWNSLGRELTADRVLDALQDLHDKGIKISTVIIDDNWQTLDSENRWDRFEANKNFPRGLIGLTSEIKIRFKNIQHIAVWHAKIGYWGGISPTGWIAAQYKTTTIKWHGGDDVMVVDEKDVNRLYSDFYRFLSNNGIDSIKCDVQSSLHEFDNAIDRKRLGHAYQDAFRINSLRYFSGRVIYCMAEDPDIFFHSLLKKNGPTVLLRNSDGKHTFNNTLINTHLSRFLPRHPRLTPLAPLRQRHEQHLHLPAQRLPRLGHVPDLTTHLRRRARRRPLHLRRPHLHHRQPRLALSPHNQSYGGNLRPRPHPRCRPSPLNSQPPPRSLRLLQRPSPAQACNRIRGLIDDCCL